MNFLLSLILLVAALLLVFLARLASDVRVIRDELLPSLVAAVLPEEPTRGVWKKRARRRDHDIPHDGLAGSTPGHFLIWEWRDGTWSARDVPKGVAAGSPPSYAGAFDGDMAKTWVATKR